MIGGADGHGDWGVCDPGRAAQPPHPRQHRGGGRQGRAAGRYLARSARAVAGLPRARVDAILFTHAHADHITGLDDVRILNRIAGRPLDAFATAGDAGRDDSGGFPMRSGRGQPPGFYPPGAGDAADRQPGRHGVRCRHRGAALRPGPRFTPRSLGLRIGGFGYSTDVVALDDAAFAALAGVDTWVVDCFLRDAAPHARLLDRVLDWVGARRPRRTVLTHMGTDMDWAWLRGNLPPGSKPGSTGWCWSVPTILREGCGVGIKRSPGRQEGRPPTAVPRCPILQHSKQGAGSIPRNSASTSPAGASATCSCGSWRACCSGSASPRRSRATRSSRSSATA